MPCDPGARARMKTWMFAALNTVEPPIQILGEIDRQQAEQESAGLRRPAMAKVVMRRLANLSDSLDGRDYLEGRFTAADLLMTTVLRILRHTDLLSQFSVLQAYRRRCEARPAFQKALADQMAAFARNAPSV
jgi:glutathione S-transferase